MKPADCYSKTNIIMDRSFEWDGPYDEILGSEDRSRIKQKLDYINECYGKAYEIGEKPLGKGGFAQVYPLVDMDEPDKNLVVKHVSIDKGSRDLESSRDKIVEMQEREIAITYQLGLDERFIPKVHNCYTICDDAHEIRSMLIIMDRYETLGDVFNADKEEDLQKVALDILTVLKYLHSTKDKEQAVFHRDIKPENILVNTRLTPPQCILIDYNVSRTSKQTHLKTGTFVGTKYYVPPEKYRGEEKNYYRHMDIYSLGSTIYELITRELPTKKFIDGEGQQGVVDTLYEKGDRLGFSREFLDIIIKSVSYDELDRYQYAEDMMRDIRNLQEDNTPADTQLEKPEDEWMERIEKASLEAGSRTPEDESICGQNYEHITKTEDFTLWGIGRNEGISENFIRDLLSVKGDDYAKVKTFLGDNRGYAEPLINKNFQLLAAYMNSTTGNDYNADTIVDKWVDSVLKRDDTDEIKKLAELGITEAQYQLGFRYNIGKGVRMDKKTAFKWFKAASDNGSSKAKCQVAYAYLYGSGPEKDIQKAKSLFEDAERQGDVTGTRGLGNVGLAYGDMFYENQDYDQAMKWYLYGSDHGNAASQCSIAIMFERGDGVEKDTDTARRWYNVAAENGDPEARNKLRK